MKKLVTLVIITIIVFFAQIAPAYSVVDFSKNYKQELVKVTQDVDKASDNFNKTKDLKTTKESDLAASNTLLESQKVQLLSLEDKYTQTKNLLESYLIESYINGPNGLELFISIDSANKNIIKQEYGSTSVQISDQDLKRITKDISSQKKTIKYTEDSIKNIEKDIENINQQLVDIDKNIQKLNSKKEETQKYIQKQDQYIAELVAKYSSESYKLTADAAVRTAASGKTLPLPFLIVTSPFSPRVHPITGEVTMHTGVDLMAPTGTPVYAVADGVVTISAEITGYGNYICIKHNDSTSTCYAHNSKLLKPSGSKVIAGDVIALVGSTGASTGPHLHFELYVNGTAIDPLTLYS